MVATKIDATTLKYTIVELKDLKGMSFQQIANYIESEYGIVRTRQAIGKMYQRAKEGEKEQFEQQKLVCDIINIHCLCDSATDTLSSAEELGLRVTYRQILQIIKENQKYIDCVEHTLVANIQIRLSQQPSIKTISIDDLRKTITYKGIQISYKRLTQYLEQAYVLNIKDTVMKKITEFYNLTNDKIKARGIGEIYNIDTKTGELIESA